ncbi:hypothetical protein [Falsiphaeobacter marinintestinus]|uniref:hypothetical protein n=1 Tax=Falsiphaeobacter marinintestinus TaxID=1492905 RepID=UPI0011B805A3|nr:hypothetical protein [Phaeobacter marinintestinus]
MQIKDIATLLRGLPRRIAYAYYPGREDAWLLAHLMPGDTPVADLRRMGLGKLLNRPLIKPLVAGCGGTLRLQDVLALAYATHTPNWNNLSAAGAAQLNAIYADPWLDFELSFSAWGDAENFAWQQTSRPGTNLVIQLGFPSDHAALMGRYLSTGGRKAFEFEAHPIRLTGRPTLAWARVDLDPKTGTVLIEEVQSDWLRFVREEVEDLAARKPRSRETRSAMLYEAALREQYDKLWPKVMLLVALELMRDHVGCSDFYMHRPDSGAVLKNIHGAKPPKSLYSTLPKAFGFRETTHIPAFLGKRHRELRKSLGTRKPVFWHLGF